MIAKCAHPACRIGFAHVIGGRFFRFRLTQAEVPIIPGATQNAHHVIWLCPFCSKMSSLIHVETGKVILRLLDQEFEVAPPQDQMTAE